MKNKRDFKFKPKPKAKQKNLKIPTASEKLQKVLARCGLGSRREIEKWIEDKRVSVNGKLATLGDRITLDAKVRVDKRQVNILRTIEHATRVLLYHKPAGEVCTRTDPEGRTTVFENLPRLRGERWIMVGRLDLNTSGLLLFTTDGELANRLLHPSSEVEREYAVRVLGRIEQSKLEQLTKGVQLDDGMAKFDMLRDAGGEGANHWYHVVLHEGRNREVRRLWESQGAKVSRLIRIRFGSILLPRSLRAGRYIELTEAEIKKL